jgi:polyhydroxybutyrate depolymerase
MRSLLGGIACLALTVLRAPGAFAQADDAGTLRYQGVDRHYVLHKGTHEVAPAPVVVALHGLDETLEALRGSWTMDAVADREGFDILYPEALAGRWAYVDSRPVALPDGGLVDDIGFINSLLDKLMAEHVVDAAHVYVAGASNGGLMAWTLACATSDRIAAVAPLITGMIERQVEQCHPQRLVPLVVIAGTDDWVQAYDGAMAPTFRLLSVPESLEYWRRLRGCQSRKLSEPPRHEPTDPTAAVLVEWTECKDPSPQRFYRIEGGGHFLPSFAPLSGREKRRHGGRSQTIETAEELWSFFHTSAPER